MVIPVGHLVFQVDKLHADDKPYDLKLKEFPGFALFRSLSIFHRICCIVLMQLCTSNLQLVISEKS